MSLAYISIYNKKFSVDHDPATDFRIGAERGVVGAGVKLTDKKLGLEWFTILDGTLVYNGPLKARIDENPWAASGRKWYTYAVDHHAVLGRVDDVLAAAGLTRAILPHSQNRFVKNPDILKLVSYARRCIAGELEPSKSIPAPDSEPSKTA
jgi:hypothetical protein